MKNEKNEKWKEPLHKKIEKVYIYIISSTKEGEDLTYPLMFQHFFNPILKVYIYNIISSEKEREDFTYPSMFQHSYNRILKVLKFKKLQF
jgi:hypothetical protein